MARTAITAQEVVSSGLEAVTEAANVAGNSVVDNGRRVLVVVNGDASDKTVTLPTPGTVGGLAIADRTVTVTAGERRYIALGSEFWQSASDPTVHVDYSAVTSVTVYVLELPAD